MQIFRDILAELRSMNAHLAALKEESTCICSRLERLELRLEQMDGARHRIEGALQRHVPGYAKELTHA